MKKIDRNEEKQAINRITEQESNQDTNQGTNQEINQTECSIQAESSELNRADLKLSDFYFDLPEDLIAQHPMENRSDSRLLVLNKMFWEDDRIPSSSICHEQFKQIGRYLRPGDCLVLNETKVIPARLLGVRESGATAEFLLLRRLEGDDWEVICKPADKLKVGRTVQFGNQGQLKAKILGDLEDGKKRIRFSYEGIFEQILDELGQMPIPPYIKAPLLDKGRYQTVYAKNEGSAAAPTAGLHFTEELLSELAAKGVRLAKLTLHVGLGTFRPVRVNIQEHVMHSEYYELSQEQAEIINKAKADGGRIIAVGTTSCRTLETIANESGRVKAAQGFTDIFIFPGYRFKIVDALITNFHLPESTLIMLVSALAGRDQVLTAYKEAIALGYRFYSFGDAMFIQ